MSTTTPAVIFYVPPQDKGFVVPPQDKSFIVRQQDKIFTVPTRP